jgi:hypothetical protein
MFVVVFAKIQLHVCVAVMLVGFALFGVWREEMGGPVDRWILRTAARTNFSVDKRRNFGPIRDAKEPLLLFVLRDATMQQPATAQHLPPSNSSFSVGVIVAIKVCTPGYELVA